MSPEEKPKMKPWLKSLLVVSLALNLAVAGLAAGAALRFAGGGRDAGRPPPSIGGLIYRGLDRDTRDALRRSAEGPHESFRERRRAEGEAVTALLRAEPFDAAALGAMLDAHASDRHAFQLSLQKVWLEKVAAMSPGERAEYAGRLQEILERGPHHGGGARHHGGGRP